MQRWLTCWTVAAFCAVGWTVNWPPFIVKPHHASRCWCPISITSTGRPGRLDGHSCSMGATCRRFSDDFHLGCNVVPVRSCHIRQHLCGTAAPTCDRHQWDYSCVVLVCTLISGVVGVACRLRYQGRRIHLKKKKKKKMMIKAYVDEELVPVRTI